MNMMRTLFLAGSALTVGAVSAVLVSPLIHSHEQAEARIRPMWAHHYQSLDQMTRDADAVVVAKVQTTLPGRSVAMPDGRRPLPFTLVDLVVEEVVHGEAGAYVVVEQTGGIVGDVTHYLAEIGRAHV